MSFKYKLVILITAEKVLKYFVKRKKIKYFHVKGNDGVSDSKVRGISIKIRTRNYISYI